MRLFNSGCVETLELRSLLSVAPVGIVDSLTVKPQVTTSGTSIMMKFTEKNTSNHDITVDYGPQIDGFAVEQHATVIWKSNAGLQPAFVAVETLKPGQSFTIAATWDGRTNQNTPGLGGFSESGPHLSGQFTVSNELAAGRVTATVILLPTKHR